MGEEKLRRFQERFPINVRPWGQQLSIPSKVHMLLRSILVMESSLMSPVNASLPQPFKFFSLMLESHATIWGVISPVRLGNESEKVYE